MAWFGARIVFDNEKEYLTGVVQNKKASDIEERWARAVAKIPDWGYSFRERISPLTHKVTSVMRNLPGELEIDFLMYRGTTILPILLDGEIGHFYTAWQKAVDEGKLSAINQALKSYGAQPALRLPTNKNDLWRLATQDSADALAKEVLA